MLRTGLGLVSPNIEFADTIKLMGPPNGGKKTSVIARARITIDQTPMNCDSNPKGPRSSPVHAHFTELLRLHSHPASANFDFHGSTTNNGQPRGGYALPRSRPHQPRPQLLQLASILQSCTASTNGICNSLDGFILTNDPFMEFIFKMQ